MSELCKYALGNEIYACFAVWMAFEIGTICALLSYKQSAMGSGNDPIGSSHSIRKVVCVIMYFFLH